MSKIQCAVLVILIIFAVMLGIVIVANPSQKPVGETTAAPTGNVLINPTDTGSDGSSSPGAKETPIQASSATPNATETPSSATSVPATNPPAVVTEIPSDPSKPLAGIVVCLDPGHQGSGNKDKEPCAPWGSEANSDVNYDTLKSKCTSGTAGKYTNVAEYIVTLDISLKIRTVLESLGATVVMTRDTHDIDISNKERAEVGNNAGADVVLRIHCNGAENTSVKGIELYVRDKGDNTSDYKARSDYDYSLASELITYLIDATGANNRGVKRSDAYTGTNWSKVPSIIIECGFMSNEEEDNLLVSDAYQQKLANAIGEWLKNSDIIGKQ